MRFLRLIAAGLSLGLWATALAQTPTYKGIGRAPTKQEIEAWDISIGPDGKGLPVGSGSAKEGASIFVAKCAGCHGMLAEGGKIGPQLAADKAAYETLTTLKPGEG